MSGFKFGATEAVYVPGAKNVPSAIVAGLTRSPGAAEGEAVSAALGQAPDAAISTAIEIFRIIETSY